MTVVEPGKPARVVDTAAAGAGPLFTVAPRADGGAPTLEFRATLTGAFTALMATLEYSCDGGTTFQAHPAGTGLNFRTAPVRQVRDVVPGWDYRLNFTLFAGGTRVSINAEVIALPAATLPLKAVDGATGTGTTQSKLFTVGPRAGGLSSTIEFEATATGNFTALRANLEYSCDGNTWHDYPGATGLDFRSVPVQQVQNVVPGRDYRLNITNFAGGTQVSVNGAAVGAPGDVVEFRKLEYERASIRYNNIYEAMWQIFSYMTAIAAAILTFGGDRLQLNFLLVVACLPLLFWFWATYLPLDAYGRNCLNTLKQIETDINRDWPGANLFHYRDFGLLTSKVRIKGRGTERVKLRVCLGAVLLHAAFIVLVFNLFWVRKPLPWAVQKTSETKVTITNLGELKPTSGRENAPAAPSQQRPSEPSARSQSSQGVNSPSKGGSETPPTLPRDHK